MKILAAVLVLLGAFSLVARAQVSASWVQVSPAHERFTVQMPRHPSAKIEENSFAQISFKGRVYRVTSAGVEYTVWALKYPESYRPAEGESYLDAFADLVWESLLKPLRNRVPESEELDSYMHYGRELTANELYGREYSLVVRNQPGLVHIISEGQVKELYVLTVLNADAKSAETQRFVNSFSLVDQKEERREATTTTKAAPVPIDAGSTAEPSPGIGGVGVGAGSGMGPGRGPTSNVGGGDANVGGRLPAAPIDYNRIFASRDVTQKALILSKPPPRYTTSARKYDVEGSVVMRAVLSRSGKVTDIRVLKALPHGLTEKAIEAAKLITFVPASKDGHVVSQYVQLELNFHLY